MSDSARVASNASQGEKRRGTVEYGVTLPQGEHCAATIVQSSHSIITTVELRGETIEFTQRFIAPPDV